MSRAAASSAKKRRRFAGIVGYWLRGGRERWREARYPLGSRCARTSQICPTARAGLRVGHQLPFADAASRGMDQCQVDVGGLQRATNDFFGAKA
jgi:hypothetical protein